MSAEAMTPDQQRAELVRLCGGGFWVRLYVFLLRDKDLPVVLPRIRKAFWRSFAVTTASIHVVEHRVG